MSPSKPGFFTLHTLQQTFDDSPYNIISMPELPRAITGPVRLLLSKHHTKTWNSVQSLPLSLNDRLVLRVADEFVLSFST